MRTKIGIISLTLAVVLMAAAVPAAPEPDSPREDRQIALTFDDLPFAQPSLGLERMRAANAGILTSLKRHQAPAVGFVNEGKLYTLGEIDARTALLQSWLDAGHELGNHTFSHPSLQDTPLSAFEEDVMRGETVTRLLLDQKGRKLRYFRHPFLRTGPTLAARAAFEAFLAGRGYTVAPVTIENSDYLFSARYSRAKTAGDRETMRRAAKAYLAFTAAQLDFWEGVSREVMGRQVRHVLLLHANEINADHLDGILGLLRQRGYRFVTLDEALRDEAYRQPDTYAGRAGVSWLYRWAVSRGVRINWKKEPEPPGFVQEPAPAR